MRDTDTESDPRWGWLGLACETMTLLYPSLVPRPSITLRGGRPGKTPTQMTSSGRRARAGTRLGIDVGLVSSPDQIFRARPADSSKNRVWTLSLRKLGQVYIWWAVNWVIVGVNYIISNQQRLLWRQKICKLAIL